MSSDAVKCDLEQRSQSNACLNLRVQQESIELARHISQRCKTILQLIKDTDAVLSLN